MEYTQNKEGNDKVKAYGIIIGLVMFIVQHAIYLLSNELAGVVGNAPFSPKTALDYLIPVVPVFILPYVWAYPYWAMAPMAVSKCDKKHFQDFFAAYLFSLIVGGVILTFAPTYMDRVAEGLMDTSRKGIFASLMRFWYSLDGGDMAYNLLPSFHCINSTIAYLGVAGRREIPKWFRIYSLITTILIYLATMFVKQHFFLDVVSGIAVALVVWFIVKKFNLGKWFRWTTGK